MQIFSIISKESFIIIIYDFPQTAYTLVFDKTGCEAPIGMGWKPK